MEYTACVRKDDLLPYVGNIEPNAFNNRIMRAKKANVITDSDLPKFRLILTKEMVIKVLTKVFEFAFDTAVDTYNKIAQKYEKNR